MFMMQNITEKGVSFVFRASEGRGPQKYLLAMLAPRPPKSRDLATPLLWGRDWGFPSVVGHLHSEFECYRSLVHPSPKVNGKGDN